MAENLEQCAVYCYQTSAAKIRVVHTVLKIKLAMGARN
jgi:hypothetical protein